MKKINAVKQKVYFCFKHFTK